MSHKVDHERMAKGFLVKVLRITFSLGLFVKAQEHQA